MLDGDRGSVSKVAEFPQMSGNFWGQISVFFEEGGDDGEVGSGKFSELAASTAVDEGEVGGLWGKFRAEKTSEGGQRPGLLE